MRKTIAVENADKGHGRWLAAGAIQWDPTRTYPVTSGGVLIGTANQIRRDEDTGEISADIQFRGEYPGNALFTVSCKDLSIDPDKSEQFPDYITRAVMMEVVRGVDAPEEG